MGNDGVQTAPGAVFAQKANWAKLSGKSRMSVKARRQMQCPTTQGYRKVHSGWKKDARDVPGKSEGGEEWRLVRINEDQMQWG